MSLFCPLYSGSSGNSFFLQSGSTSLLIDLGVSCKAAVTALSQLDTAPSNLDGILITHEHSDHIKGLPVFLKKANVPIYASEAVLDYIAYNMNIPSYTQLIPVEMDGFSVGELEVHPFRTPHDSLGSLGYRIHTQDGKRIGVATDLGCCTEEVNAGLEGCDLVLLESNYDDGMILVSDYPYYLKRRIMSQDGHLSNSACAEELAHLAKNGTEHFILCHLSLNNNMQPLAYQATQSSLAAAGLTEGKDFTLQVANRKEISTPVLV